MERYHRRFHRESEKRRPEQQHSEVFRVSGPMQILRERRCQLPRPRQLREVHKVESPRRQKERQERQQQRHAAGHRVEEKLIRRLRASLASPDAHQEKCRDQAQLPKDEPMDEVQRRKCTK